MSRRPDWSKNHRETRAWLNGSLPHWQDGWGPTSSDDRISVSNQRQKRSSSDADFGNYIVHLDYGHPGITVNLPRLGVWTESGFIIDQMECEHVFYVCDDMPSALREDILSRNRDLIEYDLQQYLKEFIKILFIYCDVSSWTYEKKILRWKFITRKKYRKA